jgi:hypothetical protein
MLVSLRFYAGVRLIARVCQIFHALSLSGGSRRTTSCDVWRGSEPLRASCTGRTLRRRVGVPEAALMLVYRLLGQVPTPLLTPPSLMAARSAW